MGPPPGWPGKGHERGATHPQPLNPPWLAHTHRCQPKAMVAQRPGARPRALALQGHLIPAAKASVSSPERLHQERGKQWADPGQEASGRCPGWGWGAPGTPHRPPSGKHLLESQRAEGGQPGDRAGREEPEARQGQAWRWAGAGQWVPTEGAGTSSGSSRWGKRGHHPEDDLEEETGAFLQEEQQHQAFCGLGVSSGRILKGPHLTSLTGSG